MSIIYFGVRILVVILVLMILVPLTNNSGYGAVALYLIFNDKICGTSPRAGSDIVAD